MLATGWAMGAATLTRTGLGWLQLWSERIPPLLTLGAQLREGEPDAGQAGGRFRDELIAIARDSSELAVRELHRGLEDLDAFTRHEESRPANPRRSYRVKP
jgi:hypothetical protein